MVSTSVALKSDALTFKCTRSPCCRHFAQQNNEDPTAEQQEVVLFRGLRLKTGMDVGHTKAEVNATTGRLAYRGRVMNRASRIAGAASTGQVLCSHEVWVQSADSTTAQRYGVGASSLGFVELKGVAERIELFCCRCVRVYALPCRLGGPKREGERGRRGTGLPFPYIATENRTC